MTTDLLHKFQKFGRMSIDMLKKVTDIRKFSNEEILMIDKTSNSPITPHINKMIALLCNAKQNYA